MRSNKIAPPSRYLIRVKTHFPHFFPACNVFLFQCHQNERVILRDRNNKNLNKQASVLLDLGLDGPVLQVSLEE